MGVLADIDQRFATLVGSRELEEAFGKWRSQREALFRFQGPDEMISFLRDQEGGYEEKDRILWAICEEAREESERSKKGEDTSRTASDLLVGLFSPALWRIFDEVRSVQIADPDEILAEIVFGFWEAVHRKQDPRMLSSELVNSARRRAWEAVGEALRAPVPDEGLTHPMGPAPTEDPDWSDPWMLVCWAVEEGGINQVQAELIFWTRLNEVPLEEAAASLGLTPNAANLRRHRAERRLESWLERNVDRYPPSDPEKAAQVIARALARPSTT